MFLVGAVIVRSKLTLPKVSDLVGCVRVTTARGAVCASPSTSGVFYCAPSVVIAPAKHLVISFSLKKRNMGDVRNRGSSETNKDEFKRKGVFVSSSGKRRG